MALVAIMAANIFILIHASVQEAIPALSLGNVKEFDCDKTAVFVETNNDDKVFFVFITKQACASLFIPLYGAHLSKTLCAHRLVV